MLRIDSGVWFCDMHESNSTVTSYFFKFVSVTVAKSLFFRSNLLLQLVALLAHHWPAIFFFLIYLVAYLSFYHEKAINALYELA